MKKIPFYSKENFFLYWRGHLQPCLRDEKSVREWIQHCINGGGDIINYEIRSNFCPSYNVHEFLEGRLTANKFANQ